MERQWYFVENIGPQFNRHIKDFCKIKKLDQPTEGVKLVALGEGEDKNGEKNMEPSQSTN